MTSREPRPGDQTSSAFDALAEAYDQWYDDEGKLIFATEVLAFKKVLPLLPHPWVEVGVGSGRFAQALGIGTGVDPSARLLELARQRGINVCLGRGEEEIFDAASFGTVFVIDAICFCDSPVDVLKEAHRILVPHSKMTLGLILKDSPWGSAYEEKKREGHPIYQFATFYTYNEVLTLLKQAGFRVEKVLSTLFQAPDRVEHVEEPREGFSPDAGFVIIVAAKES